MRNLWEILIINPASKSCLSVRELGCVFGFYLPVVHLSLLTSPTGLFTNPVNESALFTESMSFHPSIKQFFPVNKDDSSSDDLDFLPLGCIRATMKWSLWRLQHGHNPSCLDLCPALQFNSPQTTFVSINYRQTPGWQLSKDLWNEELFISLTTTLLTMYLSMNDGLLSRYFDPGKRERDLGDSFAIHIPLSVIHLPTHIHKGEQLTFINAFVTNHDACVIIRPTLTGYFDL